MKALFVAALVIAGCSSILPPDASTADCRTLAHRQTRPEYTAQSYASYRIRVDDVLVISVCDSKDADQTVFVRPDGKIWLPHVGEVPAAGGTVSELAEKLNAE